MAIYESDQTKFMREWLQQHPEQLAEMRKGRELWWDKGVRDIDTQRREQRAKVAQKAYYYDVD
jgi:hypothetical protein